MNASIDEWLRRAKEAKAALDALIVDIHGGVPAETPGSPTIEKDAPGVAQGTLPYPLPAIGSRWLHFRGRTYDVVAVADHVDTKETFVIYTPSDGSGTYARPIADWYAPTEVCGVRRFNPFEMRQ